MAKESLRNKLRQVWAKSWGWILFVLVLVVVVALLIVLVWTGVIDTGFGEYAPDPTVKPGPVRAKTLWDWLDLLLVPVLLAVGAWLMNRALRERERRTELDRSRDAALQMYLDRVSVLLRSKWRESGEGFLEANIIRAQTLTVLRQLNGRRNDLLFRFMRESGLMVKEAVVTLSRADLSGIDLAMVNLRGADLSRANLSRANLSRANLHEADLREADLREADLTRADLRKANLRWADLCEAELYRAKLFGADLSGANLRGANLRGVNLSRAEVTPEQLAEAKSLKGAALPDGTVHE